MIVNVIKQNEVTQELASGLLLFDTFFNRSLTHGKDWTCTASLKRAF